MAVPSALRAVNQHYNFTGIIVSVLSEQTLLNIYTYTKDLNTSFFN